MRAIVFATSLALAACADQQPVNTSTIDSSGIEIVTYAGDDRMLDWAADTVVVLGGANVEPSDSAFYSVTGVKTDAAGNIYVLDDSEARVLVYDSSGGFIRRLGAKGGGPGEFEMPTAMSVTGDGTVSVFDFSKRALVRFDQNGATLDQVRIEGSSMTGAVYAHGNVVIHAARHPSVGDEHTMRFALIRVADSQTTELASVDQPLTGSFRLEPRRP